MTGKDVLIDENIILSNIKTLLDIKDDKQDLKLLLYMEEAEQMILDITNRTVLIEPMATILRDLTICIYNANKISSSSTTTGFATGAVKRVTEGEQTVEYETQTGGTTTNSSGTNLNSIPISIMSRLARYKRNKVCMLYD